MPSFDVAVLVREARTCAGLSQVVLAERAGVRRQTVSRVEAGTLRPMLSTLVALLAAAGLQMHVTLEPLDADVQRAIDERRASGQVAKDVLDVWSSLFHMDQVSYRLEGLAAAAILGAPVPVPVVEIAFADTAATYTWLAGQARSLLGRVRLEGDPTPLDLGLHHGAWYDEARSEEERAADGAAVRAILARECPGGRFWFDGWYAALAARFAPPEEVGRHVVVTTDVGPIAVQPLGEIDARDGDVARVLRVMRAGAHATGDAPHDEPEAAAP